MSNIIGKYEREIKVGGVAYYKIQKDHITRVYIYGDAKGRFQFIDLDGRCMGTIDDGRAKFLFIVTNDFTFEPIIDNPDVFGIIRDHVSGKDQTLFMNQHTSYNYSGEIHWVMDGLRKAHESGKYQKVVIG